MPRANAAATDIPTAAETKFCTVRPPAWSRWPAADSPEYHCQFVLVTNETAVFHAPAGSKPAKPRLSGRWCWSRSTAYRIRMPTRLNPSTDIA
jgi:hypothetical protein